VAGKRAITADTDLRLCRYFGMSDGWWLHELVLQQASRITHALHASCCLSRLAHW
jgi:plasmid maintenance system antidote protein VapI